MTIVITEGMWAMESAIDVDFETPIFQIDASWMERLNHPHFAPNVYQLKDGPTCFFIGSRDYFVFETKDELKTWVLKLIFERIDRIDKEIQVKKERLDDWKSYADKIAGA